MDAQTFALTPRQIQFFHTFGFLGFPGLFADRIDEITGRSVRDRRSQFELAVDRMNLRVPDTALPRPRIDDLLTRARLAGQRLVESSRLRLATVEASLGALGPAKILGRGYTIARLADGSAAVSASQFAAGDRMGVTFADGSVDATVDGTTVEDAPVGEASQS